MMAEVTTRYGIPQYTYEHYEQDYRDRHLLHGVIAYWAKAKPDVVAFINADTGVEVTWARFEQSATAFALKLLDMGLKKGDFLATSLPMLTEHIFLEYACFKIGVIFTPLDLRLKGPEVIRSLSLIKAKG
jgi:fatty-acyl-CoA synthase